MKNLLIILLFISCTHDKPIMDVKKVQPEVCNLKVPSTSSFRKRKPVSETITQPTPQPQPEIINNDTSIAVFLLDFDGQQVVSPVWNNGQLLSCKPYEMADTNYFINEVYLRFSKYRVIVTVNESDYIKAKKRMRIIVTPTSAWYQGVGGVAYTGSLFWYDDTPAFVFVDRLNYDKYNIALIIAHELGHTVGLMHQSKYSPDCVFLETYSTGDGITAPIMGNPYYAESAKWVIGKTPQGCNVIQDDEKVLTTKLVLK